MKVRAFQLKSFSDLCPVIAGLVLSLTVAASAQQPAQDTQSSPEPKSQHGAAASPTTEKSDDQQGGITEEELKRTLVGKPLMLRGAYIGDSLSYSEQGKLVGDSKPASFTLCAVEIDKVYLSRRKVVLMGSRYGLHFLGALAYEDPTKGVDRVRITPKKKTLKITIDRELVVKPKKVREPKKKKGGDEDAAPDSAVSPDTAANTTAAPDAAKDKNADDAKTDAAAEKPEDQPADPNAVTTTTSPAHSAGVLRAALDQIFADSIDERMIAAMPDFWKFYYQAAAAKTDYRPSDPEVLRQNMVDQKAKLESKFEPPSNEWAQTAGVAGMSLYHVVVGADGKPGEIAVARPIGFGLDENAVGAIRAAKYEPAMKDGKPVPVMLDLVVQFRIYSKRTAVSDPTEASDKPPVPELPGPYSVQQSPQN